MPIPRAAARFMNSPSRSALLLAAAALALSGCVERIAESRVRSALVESGLSEETSACMAKRMVDRLTISQLRKLQALRGPKRSLADYVIAVRKVGDRDVLEVTASSAALCATGFG